MEDVKKPTHRVAESFEHKMMKQYFYDNLKSANNIKKMELEYIVESRRADLYGELNNGKKFVIEFQNSKISVEEIVERTKLYNSKNMYVLWILNGVSYNKTPENEDKLMISVEEEKLHRMYKGRVYYMNMTKEGLQSAVYPLHFTKCFEEKFSSGRAWTARYNKRRSVVCGPTPTLQLVFMESKRSFRLARFKDKSIQWSCIDEIKQIITGICVHKFRRDGKDWTNETTIKIPIDPIINRIKSKYGYFLPFNIMKGKIGIKVQDFGYKPDENRRYKEQILIKVSDYFNCNRLR